MNLRFAGTHYSDNLLSSARAADNGIPWIFPDGDVYGECKSACASIQKTPIFLLWVRGNTLKVPNAEEWSPDNTIGKYLSRFFSYCIHTRVHCSTTCSILLLMNYGFIVNRFVMCFDIFKLKLIEKSLFYTASIASIPKSDPRVPAPMSDPFFINFIVFPMVLYLI
jgi:hypothetical protein